MDKPTIAVLKISPELDAGTSLGIHGHACKVLKIYKSSIDQSLQVGQHILVRDFDTKCVNTSSITTACMEYKDGCWWVECVSH